MALTDDLRKTLTNATPLYVAAGTADLAAQKLRDLPATFERLRAEAPERLPKLRAQAQQVALQGVGLALEYAVKARETYDDLAKRGKTVVERRRAESGPREETTVTVERAEQVPVTEPVTEPGTEPVREPVTEPGAAEAKPKARRAGTRKSAPKADGPSAARQAGQEKSGAERKPEAEG
ncbi:hypothetical protein [Streptomyces hoynatensis]|uniref:Heparin binding hemagglutinin HbhA n=1 Tax=Streptomyces hoynatensis TaxID=1141874 RepID=A0A3A9Z116_9ACTN|nr:hypothetical protein [Streptomyces hoynatensis]RKN41830.1 hypothetical protein D7294_15375 [Streptomyces hoynatensis]